MTAGGPHGILHGESRQGCPSSLRYSHADANQSANKKVWMTQFVVDKKIVKAHPPALRSWSAYSMTMNTESREGPTTTSLTFTMCG